MNERYEGLEDEFVNSILSDVLPIEKRDLRSDDSKLLSLLNKVYVKAEVFKNKTNKEIEDNLRYLSLLYGTDPTI